MGVASLDHDAVLAVALMFSPFLGAVVVGALVWLPSLSASAGRQTRRLQDVATVGASLVSLVLTTMLIDPVTAREKIDFTLGIRFYLDALSVYFVLLVNVVALIASFYVGRYLDSSRGAANGLSPTTFHVLFNFFHFTMVLVPMVANLVVLWIAVELTTLASTFLVGSEQSRKALEAAWKYIVITSTGIIFALFGTLLLASAIQGGAVPMTWPDLIGMAPQFDLALVKLSFLFILIGYGTKAGFAPMHTWLPDGHGEAPYPVSALLSGVLLKSALYAILRFYTITNIALDDVRFTSGVLLGSGLFSLVVATPFIIKKNRFKRVLAYHSLEHMGIITFGLGIGGYIALFGALLHALNHALTKVLMFLAFGNVQENYASVTGGEDDQREEEAYRGLLRTMPWTSALLALGGLALVGSPPFNVFYSEFLVLWAAIAKARAQPTFWSVVAIAVFLISVTLIFGGLVRHLGEMLVGTAREGVKRETMAQIVPLAVLLLFVLLFGITVPQLGPLDLPRLLNQSVATVICGEAQCP